MVEVRQHIHPPSVEGAPQYRQFRQRRRNSRFEGVDDRDQLLFDETSVRILVGSDDSLVDASGDLDHGMDIVGEHCFEAALLLVAQHLVSATQSGSDAIERVTGAAAMTHCELLGSAHGVVEALPGKGDNMERVHHLDRGGEFFDGGGLESGEAVHGDSKLSCQAAAPEGMELARARLSASLQIRRMMTLASCCCGRAERLFWSCFPLADGRGGTGLLCSSGPGRRG